MANVNLDELNKQIETLRKTLNNLANEKSLTDPEIVETSKMLDALLNQYEQLLRRKMDSYKSI
ncbi:aspartyl-phosphate phosphatase Spo0E family protein [Salibacterium salarium]|uniref:Aspartyl-phosphate phosphatase Spo0E family protein n=1 Tax=Salibacterium salarium TaxID=284579 RepID=A0A3R9PB41_9BACI|nr:aspartyl-phosphate phosphatase Spo0E family protein [Salibacterium salarium]RSL34439.1 aspartyl-phosphate phosphatase Spo0E family protein [Salibacterium salarium]